MHRYIRTYLHTCMKSPTPIYMPIHSFMQPRTHATLRDRHDIHRHGDIRTSILSLLIDVYVHTSIYLSIYIYICKKEEQNIYLYITNKNIYIYGNPHELPALVLHRKYRIYICIKRITNIYISLYI